MAELEKRGKDEAVHGPDAASLNISTVGALRLCFGESAAAQLVFCQVENNTHLSCKSKPRARC